MSTKKRSRKIQVGSRAPEFTLASGDGMKTSLNEFRGKRVVLYFYPKDDTPGCTKQACSFRDHSELLKKMNTIVIGVNADSTQSHAKFAAKYDLSFQLLSDEEKQVLRAYGVWKRKSLYGRTYMGIERTTFLIDENGIVEHIFQKVRVDGHIEEILSML